MNKFATTKWYWAAGIVLVLLSYTLWPSGKSSSQRPTLNNKPIQVFVPPPPPPEPPPPPPTKEPEQTPPDAPEQEVVEEMIAQEPVTEEEPPPDELPATPDQAPGDLGTGITGDGANGYGLTAGNGAGGGRGNGGAGRGQGSRWGWYAGRIQNTLKSALAAHPDTKGQALVFELKVWADRTGRVNKVVVLRRSQESSLSSETIRQIVMGVVFPAPPEDMPMPIRMRIKMQKS